MNKFEICNISKSYGNKKILDNISFEINDKEVVGILGLNGVGKTTLLKTIAGVLKPETGNVVFNGRNIHEKKVNNVCLIEDRIILPKQARVKDIITIFNEEKIKFDQDIFNNYLKNFDVEIEEQKTVSKLSKGTQEILQMCLLLSTKPDVVILDEPFGSLDIIKRKRILNTLIDVVLEGTTIILSTHLIVDVEKFLTRAIVLDKGKIVLDQEMDVIYDKSEDLTKCLLEVLED